MKTDRMFTTLHIKADSVHDNGNGTFSIRLETVCPSDVENAMFARLFPNTRDRVYDLLGKEALLASVMSEEEMMITPSHNEIYPVAKAASPNDQ